MFIAAANIQAEFRRNGIFIDAVPTELCTNYHSKL
jgi:hypothetical protein